MNPQVSIFIPVKNSAAYLESVLSQIFSQETKATYEVVVIDSGSTDESLSILSRYPVTLYEIKPEEFGHAKTRNEGARLSKGTDYLLFLSADAVPIGRQWLEGLLKGITYEPDLRAVCAMEITRAEAPFNVGGVGINTFHHSDASGIYVMKPELLTRYSHLTGKQRRRLIPFTNVCALYDKKYFMNNMFDENVAFGEDMYWALNSLKKEQSIAYTSWAKVRHETWYSDEQKKSVMKLSHALNQELFNIPLPCKKNPIVQFCSRIRSAIAELMQSQSNKL